MDTSRLADILGQAPHRENAIKDCVELVSVEVKSKKGASGLVIKGAFSAVQKIKPGFVAAAIDGLWDEWLSELQPLYGSWRESGDTPLSDYLGAREGETVEALLAVTDKRAEVSKYQTAVKLYGKLRPTAALHVGKAIPGLSSIVSNYVDRATAR